MPPEIYFLAGFAVVIPAIIMFL
jgi:hypothetical protein